MPNYDNSLYSNTSESSRKGGGSWVYANGELYHYGRKGMKWYQTIFGGYDNPKSMIYDPNYGKAGHIGSKSNTRSNHYNFSTKVGRQNIGKYLSDFGKNYGSHVKGNIDKYYMNEFRNKREYDARKFYENSRKNKSAVRTGFAGNEYSSYLDRYADKQLRDADVYKNNLSGVENNKLMDSLNLAIQTAQFNVVNGINGFLKKNGWDDEVDNFLAKIFKGKSFKEREAEDRRVTARNAQQSAQARQNNRINTAANSNKPKIGQPGYVDYFVNVNNKKHNDKRSGKTMLN